jgi:hypothetical protein
MFLSAFPTIYLNTLLVNTFPGCSYSVVYPVIFSGGFQQIQLRTEGRENGDLGAVAH